MELESLTRRQLVEIIDDLWTTGRRAWKEAHAGNDVKDEVRVFAHPFDRYLHFHLYPDKLYPSDYEWLDQRERSSVG